MPKDELVVRVKYSNIFKPDGSLDERYFQGAVQRAMLKLARKTRDSLEQSVKDNVEPWRGLLQDSIHIRRTADGVLEIYSDAINELEAHRETAYYWQTVERGFKEPRFIPFTYPDGSLTMFGRWMLDRGYAKRTGYYHPKGYEYFELRDGTVATGIKFMYTGKRPMQDGFERIYPKIGEIVAKELARDIALTFHNKIIRA